MRFFKMLKYGRVSFLDFFYIINFSEDLKLKREVVV